jgi:hypothetical protein
MVPRQRSDGAPLRKIDPGCGGVFSCASTCSITHPFCGKQEALDFSNGSVRETQRAKRRRTATEDSAFANLD